MAADIEEDEEETFSTLEDVASWVAENDGVGSLLAWEVRAAYGADRLGTHVRANITKKLRGLGVAHYPVAFPDRGNVRVRLYRVDSGVGRIVDAVLSPGDAEDDILREASGGSAETILMRIRELVCD